MKIVFFGTPDFAVKSLERIFLSDNKICAVVTAPDKERGRGRKVSYTAVKEFALKNNLKLLQPDSLKEEKFIEELRNLQADIFVIVAFRILPRSVFTLPNNGSFNLHGSLLPKLRGAAPIQWSLINGEKETGLTTFFLQEKVDTGNIILQEKIVISDDDNFGSLHDRMSLVGADLVIRTIDLIKQNKINILKQDESLATPAPKITKEICNINWNKTAVEIHNLVRGLSPFPGAFFIHEEKIYKVYKSMVVQSLNLEAGQIKTTTKDLFIGCGNGTLSIIEIQPEGRKRMNVEDFLRGYSF